MSALAAAGFYLWGRPSPAITDPAKTPAKAAAPAPHGTMPDRLSLPVPALRPDGFIDPPPGTGLQRYIEQTVEWSDCKSGVVTGQCARIAVPLDYADPDRQAISLAVFRRPALRPDPSLAPLFVNPGGPGAAGRGAAAAGDADALPGFDIIGWDPRGTGASTPVTCGGDEAVDAVRSLDASPDDPAEEAALRRGWTSFALSCLRQAGELLLHVGTADTTA
ncbi:MAG: alpha/beta hydrolase, partial [Propionibacteriaceae bacterium]|nr:alpha/beta hydrolase [Propionibacteriaceae bacterium]